MKVEQKKRDRFNFKSLRFTLNVNQMWRSSHCHCTLIKLIKEIEIEHDEKKNYSLRAHALAFTRKTYRK